MNDETEIRKLEAALIAGNAAKFVEAVSGVIARDADTVLVTIGAFVDEPELLYAALRYASLRGVTVTVAPERDRAEVAA